MANSGPNTNACEFYLTLAPTPHLTGGHVVFGSVAHGAPRPAAARAKPSSILRLKPRLLHLRASWIGCFRERTTGYASTAGAPLLDVLNAVPATEADKPAASVCIADCGVWPPPPPRAPSPSRDAPPPSLTLGEVGSSAETTRGGVASAVAAGLKRAREEGAAEGGAAAGGELGGERAGKPGGAAPREAGGGGPRGAMWGLPLEEGSSSEEFSEEEGAS